MNYIFVPLAVIILAFPLDDIVRDGWTLRALDQIFYSVMSAGITSFALWILDGR